MGDSGESPCRDPSCRLSSYCSWWIERKDAYTRPEEDSADEYSGRAYCDERKSRKNVSQKYGRSATTLNPSRSLVVTTVMTVGSVRGEWRIF